MKNLELDPLKHNCSMCGKGQDDVSLIVAGLYGNICDECIEAAVGVLAGALAKTFKKGKPDER